MSIGMRFLGLLLGVLSWSPLQADTTDHIALGKMQELGKSLKAELMAALQKGPIHALSVCQQKAPQIAENLSTSTLKVWRVSHQPRNSQNTAEAWMQAPMDQYLKAKTKKDYLKVTVDKSTTGFIKPIRTAGLCLTCHGQAIPPNLLKEITKRYPKDQATGFQVGDIRGFFVVTVKNSAIP